MCHHGPGPGVNQSGPGGMMSHHVQSTTSLHGPSCPPPMCNPCNSNNFNSVPVPGPSRWGPRSTCPVHSPFRVRMPNGNVCSGQQVKFNFFFYYL